MKKKILPVLVVFVLVILLGTAYVIKESRPSKTLMNLQTYYEAYGQTVDPGASEAIIVLGNEILADRAYINGDHTYIPYEIVRNTLNHAFFWDAAGGQMIYAGPGAIEAEAVSDEPGSRLISYQDRIYIDASFVEQNSDVTMVYYENPSRLVIQYQWDQVKTVEARNGSALRFGDNTKSDALCMLDGSSVLRYMDETEKWYRVSESTGLIGYVKKTDTVSEPQIVDLPHDKKCEYDYVTRDYKINMVWHQVTTEEANSGFEDAAAFVSGINVISPTWFAVSDYAGNVSSIASSYYVDAAHMRGWEVWGLVDDFTYDININEILMNTDSRFNMVRQIVQYALDYNLDGINIDFEYITEESGPYFLEFLRELSAYTHNNRIALSVDNTVPEGYTDFYDLKEQGRVVDFVVIMGYDEHYEGSDAGPVASLPWVERGVQATLEMVPSSRVINAVPFYSRVWKVVDNQLESFAIGMTDAINILSMEGVDYYWDSDTCQNYATYLDDNDNSSQVWVEDQQSLATKVQLTGKYNLAGVAAWKLGLESDDVWQVISDNLYK